MYGDIAVTSLVESHGREGVLSDAFAAAGKDIVPHYVPFDVHKECKGMRYEKLDLLLD